MDLRDIVFIALAVLAAVIFYFNGFYLGVYRSWQTFRRSNREQPEDASQLDLMADEPAKPDTNCTIYALFNIHLGPRRRRRTESPEPQQIRNN